MWIISYCLRGFKATSIGSMALSLIWHYCLLVHLSKAISSPKFSMLCITFMYLKHSALLLEGCICKVLFNYMNWWLWLICYVRFGLSPTWRNIAGCTTCHSTISCTNPFYITHSIAIPRGYMDSKHSWLHTCQSMACHGCWLPHYSSYYIPS